MHLMTYVKLDQKYTTYILLLYYQATTRNKKRLVIILNDSCFGWRARKLKTST